ncbi:MAG TPA: EAL domain-containing protein, partial [Gammaproteobacteria bacterium]
DEAIGRPVAEVFHIVNEFTRERVLNPADEVIVTGKQVNLANHTVLISRDGTEYNIEDSAAPIITQDGMLQGCVLVFHDVTEKHQAKKQLEWRAVHDVLTGLPNRILLADRFQRALGTCKRQNDLLGVCMMDLDQFKPVNDNHGHTTGDRLLVQVTERLNQAVRSMDTIARLGGDEFVLLLCDITSTEEMEQVLERILAAVSAPYFIDNIPLRITASIGVAVYPLDNVDPDTLLRHADQAMYQAKQAGRNRIHWFDVAHDKQAQASHQTLARIRAALQDQELILHYQPKVDMRTGAVIGMEALLRWQHPERGLVPPLDFLPLAEQSDLIVDIGEWVIDAALRQCAAWSAAGHKWPISVNIAARHFQSHDFVERLQAILERHPDVQPHCLDLEIVESAALGDLGIARGKMLACQARGVSFSLDDFGTGYSSLSYLKRLPAETLKIDRSFVHDILNDCDDFAVVEAVIGLAAAFNRKLVAEGVETPEQGVLLLRLGCDCAQGFGIARPMPAEQIPQWVMEFMPDGRWSLWAGAQWELSDLPLLMAQHDHLAWIRRVIMSIDDMPLNMSAVELDDHQQCRFGHWYSGPGKARHGHLREFSAIEPLHIQVHQTGKEIVRLHKSGDSAAARSLCKQLLELKDSIFVLLSALQYAILRKSA